MEQLVEIKKEKKEQMFFHAELQRLKKSAECEIYKIQNDTGTGMMSFYTVFPGVLLIFNDFHMRSCESGFSAPYDMFCIDYCREGRIEQETEDGAYIYLGAGDFFVDRRSNNAGQVEFPSSHYHGITVSFMLEYADYGIKSVVKDFPIDIAKLREKYCDGPMQFVLQNEKRLEQIFQDFYFVPTQIQIPWFRVKMQELLLYLDALELPQSKVECPYFYKAQIEKVKAMHTLMTEHLDEHYTLKELSERFEFPMTAMKNCFKSVYGDSIFSYMRSYRMNRAAFLLQQDREKSVLDIATSMGYDSPGKFSTAFKEIMGESPLNYRKKYGGLDKKISDR